MDGRRVGSVVVLARDESSPKRVCLADHARPDITSFTHMLFQELPISNPVSNADFVPESLGYYTSHVLPAIWPACIVLGLSLALFVGFILWRSIRRCLGRWGGKSSQDVDRLELLLKLERVRAWGFGAAFAAAALTAGCVLAMVWAGPHLVPGAFNAVQDARVRSYERVIFIRELIMCCKASGFDVCEFDI